MAQVICPTPGSQLTIDEPTGILGISPIPSLPPVNSWLTPVITLSIRADFWIDWSNGPHMSPETLKRLDWSNGPHLPVRTNGY